ncbi:MAG: archaetidylserine decarboxylase [Myxococcota bacterium]|jgi:phosphatidylserine decarboxylase
MSRKTRILQGAAVNFVKAVPRRGLSRFIGALARTQASNVVIPSFVKAFKIDVCEAELGLECYNTLEDFFTRRLKPGARKIAGDPSVLASPVDGVLQDWGRVVEKCVIHVKGQPLNVAELTGGKSAQFRDGGFTVHYLSPRDYHWIHAPIEGRITGWHHTKGDYLPVFPKSLEEFGPVFTRNERMTVFLDTPLGSMAVVMVAAMGVADIGLPFARDPIAAGSHIPHSPITVERGGDLGVFRLGSTVVVIWSSELIAPIEGATGRHLKMGEAFARVA